MNKLLYNHCVSLMLVLIFILISYRSFRPIKPVIFSNEKKNYVAPVILHLIIPNKSFYFRLQYKWLLKFFFFFVYLEFDFFFCCCCMGHYYEHTHLQFLQKCFGEIMSFALSFCSLSGYFQRIKCFMCI